MMTNADFRDSSQAGRDLAHWHLNYETVACHPGVAVEEVLAPVSSHAPTVAERRYRVTKMKFAKTKDSVSGKNVNDKTTVIYNEFITLTNIPLTAYEYVVNGKPAPSPPTTTSSTASPPSNGSWSANPSPPTKTAASPTTPTSGPPKPCKTPSIR